MALQKRFDLDSQVHIRISKQDLSAVADYAASIQAPVSYALRRLISKGLAAETETKSWKDRPAA